MSTATVCTDVEDRYVTDLLELGIMIDAGTAGRPRSFVLERAQLDRMTGLDRDLIEQALVDAIGSPIGLYVEARFESGRFGSHPDAYRISEREPTRPCITTLP